jgi:excisionase family DNA binding protein
MPKAEQRTEIPAQVSLHGNTIGDGAIPFTQRLTCTVGEACNATGLGRTKLYELIGAGCLDTTKVGRRRLISVHSLRALLAPRTT